MKSPLFKKAIPHLIALFVVFLVVFTYFNPMFSGKVLKQYDVLQWKATYQEIAKFEKETGERTFWTNSIFGGMPSYLIGATYHGNWSATLLFKISDLFKNPADTFFFLFISFYLLMLTFEVSPWLAIIGSLAFALSSFNFINFDAGHITKGNAIAFIPLVLAGINYAFRKNKLLGAVFAGIAVSLELAAGHVQITYYLLFIIIAWMIVELVQAIKNKTIPDFIKTCALLAVAAAFGVGTNITGLMTTEEYGRYSIRGKSELTKTINGEDNAANSSSGLDKDYALGWSNGVLEPLTLLIPDFYGGASNGELGKGSQTYALLKQNGVPDPQNVIKQMPLYWGDQPFTAGPIYYGAIIVFLFVFGMFLVKSQAKWWIFGSAMIAIFLSMGKNFMPLTDIFFNFFPLYNKFRSVTFILCVSQTMFPLLAILTLKELMDKKYTQADFMKALKFSGGIIGGICLIFALLPGMFFDFASQTDPNLPEWLRPAIVADREGLMRMDALRSLGFVAAAIGLLWFLNKNKLQANYFMMAIGLLVVVDLWGVDKRYLNDRDFEKKKADNSAVERTSVDDQILADPDPHYRVYNNTTDFDKDALTAYYHKSVGGYHGAKMRRFQELIEWHLSRQNMEAFNMLNVKYFIVQDSTGRRFAERNPFNNGNAWFIKGVKWVNNADEEIAALTGFRSKDTAIIDKRYEAIVKDFHPQPDSIATIVLTKYQPNKEIYQSNCAQTQLAVFSEIYYEKGWNAYVDGQLTPHFSVDYVLRAMLVPAGKHTIEFRFEPKVVETGERIALASSGALYGGFLLILAFSLFKNSRKKEQA